jgi:hypothetical protein
MKHCLFLLILITSLSACSGKLFRQAPNSFNTTNRNNNLILTVYNDQAAISLIYIIQSTAVSGFTQDITNIAYNTGENITVSMKDDYKQVFIIDNKSGIRDEGKTSLKYVDGITMLEVLNPQPENNKTIEKFLRRADFDPAGCDKDCKSGGCGSTECTLSIQDKSSKEIAIASRITCREGYFACCTDNKLRLSQCIHSSCCK